MDEELQVQPLPVLIEDLESDGVFFSREEMSMHFTAPQEDNLRQFNIA